MTNFYDELPEAFDPSAHEGTGDLECMPAGWYLAQIVENEVRDAANGNGTYLLAVFEILEGEYRGHKVYQNVTLQNQSQQAVEIGQRLLTDIYTAVGITTPTKDIHVMLFKPVKARLGIKRDKDGVYPDRNSVTSVRPPDFEPKRGRFASPTAAATSQRSSSPAPKSSTPNSSGPRGDLPWR
jgi:uncharacterized protein DUF669